MGVSLSLEGTRQARGRGRGGQHTRSAEDQACLDALAAFLRSDALGAGRCLGKLSRASLAARLLPAARALVRAADLMLTNDPGAMRGVDLDFVLSPACLLGLCREGAGANPCLSHGCQHGCHADGVPPSAGQGPRSRRRSL